MQKAQFISERIVPDAGRFDPDVMSRGEPSVPKSFTWRGQRYEVARVIESTRQMGEDRGDTYVRRHYHDVETCDALRLRLYFDRNPSDRSGRKHWWLYTLTLPEPVIMTERVDLRRWTFADHDAFFHMVQDAQLMTHLHDFVPMSDAQAQSALEATIARYEDGYGDWAIVERTSGDIIGESGLTPVDACKVEIGWMLLPPYQGKGYALEVAAAVKDYALGPLGLPGLIAYVRPHNDRSRRVAEKIGMHFVREAKNADGHEMLEYECGPENYEIRTS